MIRLPKWLKTNVNPGKRLLRPPLVQGAQMKLNPRPKMNRSSGHTGRKPENNQESPFFQPQCFICKEAFVPDDFMNNIKSVLQNGRPVKVHRTCPKK
jgi:hypothetical protein